MIGGFKDAEAERIYQRQPSRRYGNFARIIYRKLLQIEASISLEKLQYPPGNHLEALRGDRAGQHSIRVNDQYRICFIWKGSYANEIEITDYH